ncbi:MAG: nucleotide exchange factor GrpE [Clostridia bacterium]|nr:nucleotide exchange factor GrpE [Clostridia bacterium]
MDEVKSGTEADTVTQETGASPEEADTAAEAAADTAASAAAENAEESKPKGADKKKLKKAEAELAEARKKLDDAEAALAEEKDKYLRMYAEYENFRRRTAKEKEGIYTDAYADCIQGILPVIDNLERAAAAIPPEEAESALAKGVTMTLKSATDALNKLGITEIPTETFDPNVHNAVMHVDDESLGEGVIIDVFQKGYRRGDKVIRCAMVRVAN